MNGAVPDRNMGRFGALNSSCSMSVWFVAQHPYAYCETRTDGAKTGNFPGDACAMRRSKVWRRLVIVESSIYWLKTAPVCGGVRPSSPASFGNKVYKPVGWPRMKRGA